MVARWRSVPLARRLEVVKAAKRGERHPDEAAVQAAAAYAEVCVHPGPGFWRSPGMTVAWGWVLTGLGVLVALEAVVAFADGDPGWVRWTLAVVAFLALVTGVFSVSLQRDCRRMLAVFRRG